MADLPDINEYTSSPENLEDQRVSQEDGENRSYRPINSSIDGIKKISTNQAPNPYQGQSETSLGQDQVNNRNLNIPGSVGVPDDLTNLPGQRIFFPTADQRVGQPLKNRAYSTAEELGSSPLEDESNGLTPKSITDRLVNGDEDQGEDDTEEGDESEPEKEINEEDNNDRREIEGPEEVKREEPEKTDQTPENRFENGPTNQRTSQDTQTSDNQPETPTEIAKPREVAKNPANPPESVAPPSPAGATEGLAQGAGGAAEGAAGAIEGAASGGAGAASSIGATTAGASAATGGAGLAAGGAAAGTGLAAGGAAAATAGGTAMAGTGVAAAAVGTSEIWLPIAIVILIIILIIGLIYAFSSGNDDELGNKPDDSFAIGGSGSCEGMATQLNLGNSILYIPADNGTAKENIEDPIIEDPNATGTYTDNNNVKHTINIYKMLYAGGKWGTPQAGDVLKYASLEDARYYVNANWPSKAAVTRWGSTWPQEIVKSSNLPSTFIPYMGKKVIIYNPKNNKAVVGIILEGGPGTDGHAKGIDFGIVGDTWHEKAAPLDYKGQKGIINNSPRLTAPSGGRVQSIDKYLEVDSGAQIVMGFAADQNLVPGTPFTCVAKANTNKDSSTSIAAGPGTKLANFPIVYQLPGSTVCNRASIAMALLYYTPNFSRNSTGLPLINASLGTTVNIGPGKNGSGYDNLGSLNKNTPYHDWVQLKTSGNLNKLVNSVKKSISNHDPVVFRVSGSFQDINGKPTNGGQHFMTIWGYNDQNQFLINNPYPSKPHSTWIDSTKLNQAGKLDYIFIRKANITN